MYFPTYSQKNLKDRQRNLALWISYKKYLEGKIEYARNLGIAPDIPEFRSIMYPEGQDDVIRNKVRQSYESLVDNKGYKLYDEPILMVAASIRAAEHQLKMFYELRDATLEADGKKPNGLIPYEKIYIDENLLPYARENLIGLYKLFGSLVVGLSAHNGIDDMTGREIEAKIQGMKSIIKEIEVYGTRFHATEHDVSSDEKRDRALKTGAMRRISGLDPWDPLTGHVLLDDSLFNSDDIYNEEGIPIYIAPISLTKEQAMALNRNNYAMARSIQPESILREFDRLHLNESEDKVKRKIII
jgi:hypothetical protein